MRLIAGIACVVSLLCLGEAQSHIEKRIAILTGDAGFEKSCRLNAPNASAESISVVAARSSTDTFVGRYPQNDGLAIAVLRLARDCCGPTPSNTAEILALDDAPAGNASAATAKSVQPGENNAGVANAGTVNFGGLSGSGPLGEEVASTFKDGSYTQVILNEEITLYRVYGGKAEPIGSYWTRNPPTGPLQAKIDLALHPAWGNTAEHIAIIKVPAGTMIYEGYAARQGELIGGDNQVYIPRVNPDWLLSR